MLNPVFAQAIKPFSPPRRKFSVVLNLAGERIAYNAMAASSCEAAQNAIALLADDPGVVGGFSVTVAPL
jgi:hypothetical protein